VEVCGRLKLEKEKDEGKRKKRKMTAPDFKGQTDTIKEVGFHRFSFNFMHLMGGRKSIQLGT
jgi:hypothetical protein